MSHAGQCRTLILLALASLSVLRPTPSYALDLALLGGATASQRVVSGAKSDGLLGIGGGMQLNFPLSGNSLTLESGAFYVQRNVGYTGSESRSALLQVPLLARLNFWRFSLGAGGYFGYGLGEVETESGGTVTQSSYEALNVSKTDFGALGSLNFTLPLGPSFGVIADLRYTHGLKNLSTSDALKITHNDFQFFTGLRFGKPL